ncbi:hypothetical protein [Kitasatospora fiedleri]|uniref:hypothetical protein n=1 Tax=Kitasatospora fiedleri TaxID=2991545 RepID=UPI00249AAAE1|nr:hypothetical protein [Kitasatospora fiedleri]
MRSARTLLLGGATAILVGLVAAPAAQANTAFENQWSPEACKSNVDSGFKFTLWYNSSYAGTYRNIGWSVYDFSDENEGGTAHGAQPLNYCNTGAAGSGQGIKNNAASAQNRNTGLSAKVYYNSGYRGAVDVLTPFSSWFQLKNTYNENASFLWA